MGAQSCSLSPEVLGNINRLSHLLTVAVGTTTCREHLVPWLRPVTYPADGEGGESYSSEVPKQTLNRADGL